MIRRAIFHIVWRKIDLFGLHLGYTKRWLFQGEVREVIHSPIASDLYKITQSFHN